MKAFKLIAFSLACLVVLNAAVASGQALAAPGVVRLDGQLLTSLGEPRTGLVVIRVSLYATPDDAAPLWIEDHNITLDAAGRYTVYAGSTQADGLPAELFTTNAAQWLGVAVVGEPESPRTRLLSVPYAMSAANADSLGGTPASAFVMSDNLGERVTALFGESGVKASGDVGGLASTTNRIAKFTDASNTTGDSVITESNGNIGINNPSPAVALDIAGSQATRGHFFMGDGTSSDFRKITADTPMYFRNSGGVVEFTIDANGRVGIGTSSPAVALDVSGSMAIRGQMYMGDGSSADFRKTSANTPLHFRNSGGVAEMTIDGSGNVSVSGNIGAKYQDIAEWVESGAPLEAGTVVIVDPDAVDHVVAAPSAYDTRVAGAVSRQPGLILGERGESKSLVAQSGRVRIKVDATFGAIRPGDLLVTSATPGHAMKSKPMKIGGQLMHRPGTLVGKALEGLASGKGEILVLLTLQ